MSRSLGRSGAHTIQSTLGVLALVSCGAAGAVSLLPEPFRQEPGGLGSYLVNLQPMLLLLGGLSLAIVLFSLKVDTAWRRLRTGLALAVVAVCAVPTVRLILAESQRRAARLARFEADRQSKLAIERALAEQAAAVAEAKRLAALPPPPSSLQPCVGEWGNCTRGERCFDGLCHKRCSFSPCPDSESCHTMRFGADDTPQFDGICFAHWPPEAQTSVRRPLIQLHAPAH